MLIAWKMSQRNCTRQNTSNRPELDKRCRNWSQNTVMPWPSREIAIQLWNPRGEKRENMSLDRESRENTKPYAGNRFATRMDCESLFNARNCTGRSLPNFCENAEKCLNEFANVKDFSTVQNGDEKQIAAHFDAAPIER